MKEKLTFIKKKPVPKDYKTKTPRIRITTELYNEIAAIAIELNISMTDVSVKMIEFALKHIEIKNED